MSLKCNYCANKKQCNECDKSWKDKFIPLEEVKQYFNKSYVGIKGINGCQYFFDNTKESLVSTHSIQIGNKYYCPYCGETMYSIQDKQTLEVIGYCCICQGARDEIDYEIKKRELGEKYAKELDNLQNEYKDKLLFCSDKLFEIKQEQERKDFNFYSYECNHFSTLNGKVFTTIEQLIT